MKSEEDLIQWLNRLFHNEREADRRFVHFATKFCVKDPEVRQTFMKIANQESGHAHLVLQVMVNRGYTPWIEITPKERYWNIVKHLAEDPKSAAAVGAYAETTSLTRLQILVDDPRTPEDLRQLFQKILSDERSHAKVLEEIAGPEMMEKIRPYHEDGLKNLGIKK